MKAWLDKIAAWYRRRFRGYIAAPRIGGGKGTAWQQHTRQVISFPCRGVGRDGKVCHQVLIFTNADYVIREQLHAEGCEGVMRTDSRTHPCRCPVLDARYIKICPGCGLGHWKQAL